LGYRNHAAPSPLLFGYDPFTYLPNDHLCRLVEQVVEESIGPPPRTVKPGQPAFDPRLPLKVLVYGYAVGIRSSRALEANCRENLPFLFLTRGDAPSYRTLCTVRTQMSAAIEDIWVGLQAVAEAAGISRLGRIRMDSSKIRADASPESVLKDAEFEDVLSELRRILKEAEETDAREDEEGRPGTTHLGKTVSGDLMRDIVRRVRKRRAAQKRAATPAPSGDAAPREEPVPAEGSDQDTSPAETTAEPDVQSPAETPIGPRMLERVRAGIEAIEMAKAEELRHVSLTDPDARMMGEGREKRICECHSLEVVTDNGHVIVGQTTSSSSDNSRLLPLVEAAKPEEPDGIKAVDADSGYYSGDGVAALLLAGIDTCIPDSNTAADLRRGQPPGTLLASTRGSVAFLFDADADVFRCPQDNVLAFVQWKQSGGQRVRYYRAQRECRGCPLAGTCLSQRKAKHRTLAVGEHHELLQAARARFADPDHVQRYHRRADAVETVFGFMRSVLGYTRWMLRGDERVACEGQLFKVGYEVRKIHKAWRTSAA
jgi:hypothetical protein